jgi:hypothetical protein
MNQLGKHGSRLREVQNKSDIIQRELEESAKRIETLLLKPEQLTENLEDRRIDGLMERGLARLQACQSLVASQILELDTIARELDEILDKKP